MNIKKTLSSVLLGGVLTITMSPLTSCGEKNTEKEKEVTVVNSDPAITTLLERDASLSQEEFVKIKERYNKYKTQYYKNKKDYKNILKLAEIYIFEARVTGEHPYYYTAALDALNFVLSDKGALSRDDLFTALFYKSTVQLSQHNFTEALNTGEKALAINDLNSGIYGSLVDANVEIGNYDEAVKMSDKMMTIRPDLRSYSRVSYLREIFGDLAGSKVAMQKAIKAGAPYSEYKCWSIVTLGKIYESEGKLDSAAICYDIALLERPNYPFAIAGLASVQANKGNIDSAYTLYNEAINILPEIGFNIDLAALKMANGKEDEAKKMTAEIETMFTEDIESGHNMNLEYAEFLADFKQDYKKALDLSLVELKSRPNNIDVNKQLAFTYIHLNELEKAKEHLAIAMKTGKKDAELICLDGILSNDASKVEQSFKHNPYQSHSLVAQAKSIK